MAKIKILRIFLLGIIVSGCSRYVSYSPAAGCMETCHRNFVLCLLIYRSESSRNSSSFDPNNQSLISSCDPKPCKDKCLGQALATSQQNQR